MNYNLKTDWYKKGGYTAFLKDGVVMLRRKWRTSKLNKKTGKRDSTDHEEVMPLKDWNPTSKTLIETKKKIEEAIKELISLSLTP